MSIDQARPESRATGPGALDGDGPPNALPTPPRPCALPVAPSERVDSVDVLRGVAVLGIFAMNIVGMAWPFSVYETPIVDPDAGPLDVSLWAFNHLVFDTKMMTIFSMLFGAGLVLMGERSEARGARWRGIYYRRIAWLLVIGLVHAYLIWEGDILVEYALCGFLLYPFRRLRPRTLILTGLVFNLLLVPLFLGFRFGALPYIQQRAERAAEHRRRNETPTWWQSKMAEFWDELSKDRPPTREENLREIAEYRVPYRELVVNRAKSNIWGHTLGFVFGTWWLVGGRMLIGMGLMKLGVFGASCAPSTYRRMIVLGYGVGLPLMAFDAWHEIRNGFFLAHPIRHALQGWPLLTFYGSMPVVFGHIGAVMLICQSGQFVALRRRLSCVGRMALSHYLFDSIAATTVFYGYGLDYFGAIHRPMLYLIVLATWTAQLLVSPLWLDVFRFGPAEWVWRSLTYWRLQPLRASPPRGAALADAAAT